MNTFPTLAWKSHKHSDGEAPFGGGWFIVGVDTPKGPYTYHYEDKDWDLFHCKEVATAPEWDGHTDKDVERVLSLSDDESDWATREVALASQKERESAEDKDDWDYGVACYESALRAYRSLERDGHSGMSMEPVIRPVLDLSAVSAGADALNNLFYSQRAVGLVGQAAVAFEAQRGGSSQTTISVDNDDVVAELRTLRGEMASMLERMEKLRVVLNTGALVGELAEPMDVALGQRSTQRGRGI